MAQKITITLEDTPDGRGFEMHTIFDPPLSNEEEGALACSPAAHAATAMFSGLERAVAEMGGHRTECEVDAAELPPSAG